MADTDPALIGESVASPMDWEKVATILYEELKRWGWGDFHYGPQPQDPKVVAALKVYEDYVTPWRGDER